MEAWNLNHWTTGKSLTFHFLLKNSLVFQIFQAAFSLVLPVLAAIAGYFLMPEKESLQVLGILLGFGITAAIVTITSRFLPPVKSQIDRVL